MKVILEIEENNKTPFFLDLLQSLDYVKVLKKINREKKLNTVISDWIEAFDNVKSHESGEIRLKNAKEALNELHRINFG